MPLLIIVVGLVLLVASIRGKQTELFTLIKGDFSGSDSFILWIGVFAFIYIFGKIDATGKIAKYFGILVILGLMLTKGRGFFDQLNRQVKEITQ